MSLEPRDFTMNGQWAALATTNIPSPPVRGTAYRNADVPASTLEAGAQYGSVADSANLNQLWYVVSGIVRQLEQYGGVVWSPYTNYTADVSTAIGSDGSRYTASQNSGPANGGPQNPVSTSGYWVETKSGSGGGGYVGEMRLMPFRKTELPDGWYACDGTLYGITTPQGAVLYRMSTAFKTDWRISTNGTTINIPDLFSNGNGLFFRPVDGNSRQIGSMQDSAIDEHRHFISGSITGSLSGSGAVPGVAYTGYESAGYTDNFGESETRPINVGLLPSIYLGI